MIRNLDKSFSVKKRQKAISLSQMTNGLNMKGERDSSVETKMAEILEKNPTYRFSELIYVSNNCINTIDAILIVDIECVDYKELLTKYIAMLDYVYHIGQVEFSEHENNMLSELSKEWEKYQ